ncbi:hypothetical protein E1180_14140 [Roseibium denhamense]|uniref:Uncharacterized protein n=1 Tax=Roseibium denhamense TaxID=76305 RepID=A0ABY1NCV3_9HYPH|nr:hypothetical protein [Roseibium denhamense]MTI06657.1 hypothetical protein [Roseibium denhamense]SMP06346.1 hypothetical protein SAMN06265374_0780 [Roseibium denhamense]
MPQEATVIRIGDTYIEIKSLVDLHKHWPEVSARVNKAIEEGEVEDQNLCKIIEWLVILGDKTLFQSQ